jgi:hypothetical protein
MAEKVNKRELMERLRAEGRWEGPEGAEAFKNTALAEFKAKGVKNAAEEAWAAMASTFPPLQAVEAPAAADPFGSVEAALDGGEGKLATGAVEVPGDFIDVDALLDRPEDLASPDLAADICWAYANLANSRAMPDTAPNLGAWSLLTWARGARNRFFEQLLPRALAARDKQGEEQQNIRKEKIAIAEIEALLAKMSEGFDVEATRGQMAVTSPSPAVQ